MKKVDDVLDKEMKELASKLKFTDTVGKHMDEPWRTIPKDTLAEAILSGERMADPQGAVGAVKIVSTLTRNGKDYTLEIIYRESDSTILHALYK